MTKSELRNMAAQALSQVAIRVCPEGKAKGLERVIHGPVFAAGHQHSMLGVGRADSKTFV